MLLVWQRNSLDSVGVFYSGGICANIRVKVVASEELFEAVWKEKYLRNSNNTVMAHIGRLREKLNEPSKIRSSLKLFGGRV